MEEKKLQDSTLQEVAGGKRQAAEVRPHVNAEDHNVFLEKVGGDVEKIGASGKDSAFIPIILENPKAEEDR